MNNDILALKEKLDKIKNLGWIECENKNKSITMIFVGYCKGSA